MSTPEIVKPSWHGLQPSNLDTKPVVKLDWLFQF